MEWRAPKPDDCFPVWTLHAGAYRVAEVRRCKDGAQVGLKLHCYLYEQLTGHAASIAQGKRFAERWTAAYINKHPLPPTSAPTPNPEPVVWPERPSPPPDMPWVGKRRGRKRRR